MITATPFNSSRDQYHGEEHFTSQAVTQQKSTTATSDHAEKFQSTPLSESEKSAPHPSNQTHRLKHTQKPSNGSLVRTTNKQLDVENKEKLVSLHEVYKLKFAAIPHSAKSFLIKSNKTDQLRQESIKKHILKIQNTKMPSIRELHVPKPAIRSTQNIIKDRICELTMLIKNSESRQQRLQNSRKSLPPKRTDCSRREYLEQFNICTSLMNLNIQLRRYNSELAELCSDDNQIFLRDR
ncbi:hypothetical protein D5R81_02865 [Parashewanella spongiae]|uniref:Uncharacterized protein n=1 Tax=Parashewanella spongiae TaxID=342950 RepID=A0A3A6TX00_9GAMM|nr:hypothetical protein [Parashewanella spongiae]MCL1077383.1 hypothetical protein [Parashewanella spongiae]RJY18991.1 hypothetical protein D5R81_02865 [Parashewanella spongiae]